MRVLKGSNDVTSQDDGPHATCDFRRPVTSAGTPSRTRLAGRTAASRRRRGAAVVEFAIVAPVLLLLIVGIIELGRMMMVQQILTNAAREGARRAILEQSSADQVRTIVNDYLSGTTISLATVSVSPLDLDSVGLGDPVTVTVSAQFDQVSWLPAPWFLGEATLTARSVMRGERPE